MHFRNGPVAISYDSTLLLRLVDEGKGGSGSDRDRHHVGARELRSGRQRDELRRVARQRDRSIARPRRFPADEVTVFDAKRLRAGLGGGRIVLTGNREYDTARRVWNGRIDRHPAAVVFARDVKDVRATVTLAREGGARLFVRGGGHSVAGLAVGEGVVLDVSGLRDIEVDPVAGTARVGSGLRLGDVDRATQRFGVAVPLGTDSEVGLAGLTLGGGNGWLMGAHGATVDSLLSVELVCADGTVRLASADVEPDLFWALRGGGGNFGVATAFEFRLHPVGPEVVGGMIAYPWK